MTPLGIELMTSTLKHRTSFFIFFCQNKDQSLRTKEAFHFIFCGSFVF